MIWRLVFRPGAQREFDALGTPTTGRIRRAPLRLAADPRSAANVKAMQGGGYRLRLGHRREVYR